MIETQGPDSIEEKNHLENPLENHLENPLESTVEKGCFHYCQDIPNSIDKKSLSKILLKNFVITF